jgi:release factor glutamine methyltransferase
MSDQPMDITDLFILSKLRNSSFQEIVRELATNKITLAEHKELSKIKTKIEEGYPLAYVLETIEFLNRSFKLDPNVLVPRPETEEWVKNLIVDVKKQISTKYKNDIQINLVDLATGSGVIGLSLWLELGVFINHILLSDISQQALEIASTNHITFSKHFSGSAHPKFILSDLLSDLDPSDLSHFSQWDASKLNILVANLPYLPQSDSVDLPALRHEPDIALFSGQNGLDLCTKLLNQIEEMELHFDTIVLELDPRNIFEAGDFIRGREFFKNYNMSILNDFAGRNRVLRLDIL